MDSRFAFATAAAPLLVAALLACPGPEPVCRVGADCASGMCRPDGTCVPAPAEGDAGVEDPDGGGSGSGDGGLSDGGGGGGDGDGGMIAGDGGSAGADGGMAGDGGATGCLPDHDGMVERGEVRLEPGLQAPFRIAQDAAWSTAPATGADGGLEWNLTGPFTGDETQTIETLPIEGAWFADEFPGATYASRLSQSSPLLGVFEATQDALLLRGVVSPTMGFAQTRLTYSPPITVLDFPLSAGKTWTTDSTVSGWASGVWTSYWEDYASEVDGPGTLHTPYGAFPVLRVRTLLTRTIGFSVTRVRTHAFSAECFGTVASVVSRDNETEEEFTVARELRRLTP